MGHHLNDLDLLLLGTCFSLLVVCDSRWTSTSHRLLSLSLFLFSSHDTNHEPAPSLDMSFGLGAHWTDGHIFLDVYMGFVFYFSFYNFFFWIISMVFGFFADTLTTENLPSLRSISWRGWPRFDTKSFLTMVFTKNFTFRGDLLTGTYPNQSTDEWVCYLMIICQ